MRHRLAAMLALATAVLGSMGQAKVPDTLTQARELYNQQNYDEAAKLAAVARALPATADAASVVLARARLERYRQASSAGDLAEARSALKQIDTTKLGPRDGVEYLIALGLSLYLDTDYTFDDRYSAAAEQFELALSRASLLDARSRDLLFDWWALSLDRQAQLGSEAERHPLYARILDRAEQELAATSGTAASAGYWLAASARGVDDLPRALGAATAAWIRAGAMGPRGAALRQDLDRLVMQVILPERARQLAADTDARPTLTYLLGQWEELKSKWN